MPQLPTLAVTGMPSCGKGRFSSLMKSHGYHPFSTGELVRQGVAAAENLHLLMTSVETMEMLAIRDWLDQHRTSIPARVLNNPDRDFQGLYASACCAAYGGDYFIKKGMKLLPPPHLVDGLRRPSEIDAFLSLPRSVLVYLQAEGEVRYRLSQMRGEGRDQLSLEEFRERDAAEEGTGTKYAHPDARNMRYALVKAHAVICNLGDPDQFQAAAESFFEDLAAGRLGYASGEQQLQYGFPVPGHDPQPRRPLHARLPL